MCDLVAQCICTLLVRNKKVRKRQTDRQTDR